MVKRRSALVAVIAMVMAALLISACGGGTTTTATCPGGTMKMSNGEVMCKSAMGTASGNSTVHVQVSTKVPEVNGQKPVAVKLLDSADWQGMTVMAQTMTPVPFSVYSGNSERIISPGRHASFHLMIMLNDRATGAPIPYSSVWATITNSRGQTVFHNLQWPMLSAFMGPHYGNTISLPGSGNYTLSLLVSPPVGGRALEYGHVWLHPHTVTMHFHWNAQTRSATVIGGAAMSGMSAGSTMSSDGSMAMNTHVHTVNGVTAPATHLQASSAWQGMKIATLTAAPSTYEVDDGSTETRVAPASDARVDLMVELSDIHTGALIPYATVTATVRDHAGTVVARGPLMATISAFQGIYYGRNITLPGPGPYTVSLRITPPQSARHKEYWHVWLHPHTVVQHISWDGAR